MERLESGVQLYSRRVLIQQQAKVLPEWLRFVEGVVDSEDLPLNISRETLQDSRPMMKLREVLTKRAIKQLQDEAKKDEERYRKFFGTFGNFIKEGICTDGAHKSTLAELLRYDSTAEGDVGVATTLKQYVSRMKEGQTDIYYLHTSSRASGEASPYLEAMRSKGFEVLLVYTPVDEFVMGHLMQYDGKPLRSAEAADLDAAEPGEDAEALAEQELEKLCAWLQDDVLAGRVGNVKASTKLVDSPALLVGHEPEAVRRWKTVALQTAGEADAAKLAEMLNSDPEATLEVNARHPLMHKLAEAHASEDAAQRELATLVGEQLFDNARLAAGAVTDPRAMVARLNTLLSKALEA